MYQNISQGVASPLLLLFLGPGDWEDMQYNLTITGLVAHKSCGGSDQPLGSGNHPNQQVTCQSVPRLVNQKGR